MTRSAGDRWRPQLIDLLRRLVRHTDTVAQQTREAAAAAQEARAAAAAIGDRRVALRRARATLPVLALNATTQLSFVWRTPMPTETYDVDDELPDALLGKVTRTAIATTREKAVITYRASAVTVAGQVSAIATTLH